MTSLESRRKKTQLTLVQREVLVGILLGDASLRTDTEGLSLCHTSLINILRCRLDKHVWVPKRVISFANLAYNGEP